MLLEKYLTEIGEIKRWLNKLEYLENKEDAEIILCNIQSACEVMLNNLKI